jgi:hypothetical protein
MCKPRWNEMGVKDTCLCLALCRPNVDAIEVPTQRNLLEQNSIDAIDICEQAKTHAADTSDFLQDLHLSAGAIQPWRHRADQGSLETDTHTHTELVASPL